MTNALTKFQLNHDDDLICRPSMPDEPLSSYQLYLIKLKATSRSTARSFLKQIARALSHNQVSADDFPWDDLRAKHLEIIKEILRRDKKRPTTINTYLSMMRGVATTSFLQKRMNGDNHNLIGLVKGVRGNTHVNQQIIDTSVIYQVIDQALISGKALALRDATLLCLLFGAGLRRQEITLLTLDLWDRREKVLRVLGKNDKTRLVQVTGRVPDIIETWINEVRGRKPGPLICRFEKNDKALVDKGLSPQGVYHIVKTWRSEFERLAGRSMSPHDFRRAYATSMLEEGADIHTISKLLGHEGVKTTVIYDQRGEKAKRDTVEKYFKRE